jgi:hypothetical protein
MNGFAGLHVLSLESRRAPEMAKSIANNGGEALVAPSMREAPTRRNSSSVCHRDSGSHRIWRWPPF